MKKLMAMLMVLTMALSLGLAMAEATENTLDIPAPMDWADPDHQRVTAELYPAWIQGSSYTDELALDIHWPDSYAERIDYQMILEPVSNDGQTAVYAYRGDIVKRAWDDQGNLTEEVWANKEAVGQATFAADEAGQVTLTLKDDMAAELNELTLTVVVHPAPSAEEIASQVLAPLYELEEGTAGASLKAAETAADLIRFAVLNHLYAVDAYALKLNMIAALESMNWTPEAYETYQDHEIEVTDMINTLAGLYDENQENEEAVRAQFEDAGLLEEVSELLSSGVDAFSIEMLTGQLATIENLPEE